MVLVVETMMVVLPTVMVVRCWGNDIDPDCAITAMMADTAPMLAMMVLMFSTKTFSSK